VELYEKYGSNRILKQNLSKKETRFYFDKLTHELTKLLGSYVSENPLPPGKTTEELIPLALTDTSSEGNKFASWIKRHTKFFTWNQRGKQKFNS
jgi:hypothetical protein